MKKITRDELGKLCLNKGFFDFYETNQHSALVKVSRETMIAKVILLAEALGIEVVDE